MWLYMFYIKVAIRLSVSTECLKLNNKIICIHIRQEQKYQELFGFEANKRLLPLIFMGCQIIKYSKACPDHLTWYCLSESRAFKVIWRCKIIKLVGFLYFLLKFSLTHNSFARISLRLVVYQTRHSSKYLSTL